MRSITSTLFIFFSITLILAPISIAADKEKDKAADVKEKDIKKEKESLQGAWVAQSMEASGKWVHTAAAQRMRFTFKDDKLLVKGNFEDDREQECAYEINPKESPKHLDFTPAKEKKPILGIYEVKGDELKLCLRHNGSSDGRPTEFATKAGSKLVLVVLKK